MKKLTLCLLTLVFTNSFATTESSKIKKLIDKSKKTRLRIENLEKKRTPANISIDNWNDFDREMNSDDTWEKDVNKLIKEYE
tara:strand:- start:290 stop:535 length:246 start_codon:yes stop_codon:yes gene_type:complete